MRARVQVQITGPAALGRAQHTSVLRLRPESRFVRARDPRRESPRRESPRRESPRRESPRRESPRRESPRRESPRPEAREPEVQGPRPRRERPVAARGLCHTRSCQTIYPTQHSDVFVMRDTQFYVWRDYVLYLARLRLSCYTKQKLITSYL